MAPRAVLLRTLRARQLEARALPLRFPSPARPSATSISPLRAFSASSRSCNAQKEEPKGDQQQKDGGGGGGGGSSGKKQEQRQAPRPDEASGPPQSPFKVFAQVLKEEISKNKAWQENVKTLQGDVDKLADTQAMKRARDMYERARITSMIQNNPRIQAALSDMKRAGISVTEAINRSLEDSGVILAIRASYGWASDTAARATQPVRDTAVYKAIAASVEEAFDDDTGAGSRYGGYEEKEARRRRREMRAKKAGRTERVRANPESVSGAGCGARGTECGVPSAWCWVAGSGRCGMREERADEAWSW